MPEASLVFPGSESLEDGGNDAEMTVDGPLHASYWALYGSDSSIDEVRAYYESELRERGWAEGGGSSGIKTTLEILAAAWHTEDVVFRLGFQDPEEWAAAAEWGYPTLFTVTLIEKSLDAGS